jgi:polyhydroxyalkanoate synthesis repressor PhaR
MELMIIPARHLQYFLDNKQIKLRLRGFSMTNKIIIKKYPNRKLYNTGSASYISYKDIVEMIKGGDSVSVVDNRTKADITRFTLTQILFQKEREFLKSLPEETLETAIKHEEGLLFNSLTDLARENGHTSAPAPVSMPSEEVNMSSDASSDSGMPVM